MNVDGTLQDERVLAQRGVNQVGAAERLAGSAEERVEQAKLGPRQGNGPLPARDGLLKGVEFESTPVEVGLGRGKVMFRSSHDGGPMVGGPSSNTGPG